MINFYEFEKILNEAKVVRHVPIKRRPGYRTAHWSRTGATDKAKVAKLMRSKPKNPEGGEETLGALAWLSNRED